MIVVIVESGSAEAALHTHGTRPEKSVIDGAVLHGVRQLHAGVIVHLLPQLRPVGAHDIVLGVDLGQAARVALKLLLRRHLGRRI